MKARPSQGEDLGGVRSAEEDAPPPAPLRSLSKVPPGMGCISIPTLLLLQLLAALDANQAPSHREHSFVVLKIYPVSRASDPELPAP